MTHSGGVKLQDEVPVPPPQLTFACELDPARLAALFGDSLVIEDLLALGRSRFGLWRVSTGSSRCFR